MRVSLLAAAFAALALPASAATVTLDFEEFSNGQIIAGDAFEDLGVIFDVPLRAFVGGGAPVNSGSVAVASNQPVAGDITGSFLKAVNFLSVYAGDAVPNEIDRVTLNGFDINNQLVDTASFTNDTGQFLSISGPGIVSFQILHNNTLIGIDDFSFAPVPLPAGLPMLAGAIGLLAWRRKRT